jgi:hypothetical protein
MLPALAPAVAHADTLLEFLVKEPGASSSHLQTVTIKEGQMLAKGAGGDPRTDLFFNRATEQVTVIDHRQRTVMTVDEGQIDRLGQQAKTVQPLMQEIGQQLAKLSPEERGKWQALVGENFSLEEVAKAATPPPPTCLLAIGRSKAAGIPCQTMRVTQGRTPLAELCMAEADALAMPAEDFATVRALVEMYERIAPKAQRLASQFGLTVPMVALGQVQGIPIVFSDLSRAAHASRKSGGGEAGGSVTLRRINTTAVSPAQMRIPKGYASKQLQLW